MHQFDFVYSYFEKGCRKKFTRQSRKALWVVLSSLFFREIWKNWHERPWKCVCECYRKAKKVGSTATVARNSVSIISHITFLDCCVHIFSNNLSQNSCILMGHIIYSVLCILIKVSLLRPALFYRKTVTTTNSVKLWRWFLDQQSGGTYLDNSNGKKSESRQDFEMFVYGMEYILIGLIYTLRYVEPLYRGKVSSHHRATTAVKFRWSTRLKMRIFYLCFVFLPLQATYLTFLLTLSKVEIWFV